MSEKTTSAATTTSQAVTRGIRVMVEARYSPEHSDPSAEQWFFLYTVRIANEGDEAVQLMNRRWIITDATGQVEEVRGAGVVGKQPRLEPGQSFTYTSGCPLPTPYGAMHGTYEMVTAGGVTFDAEIGMFILRHALAIH